MRWQAKNYWKTQMELPEMQSMEDYRIDQAAVNLLDQSTGLLDAVQQAETTMA
jgi:hypothetical protein